MSPAGARDRFGHPRLPFVADEDIVRVEVSVYEAGIVRCRQATLQAVKAAFVRRRHEPVPDQGAWRGSVVRGYLGYYGTPLLLERTNAYDQERFSRTRT